MNRRTLIPKICILSVLLLSLASCEDRLGVFSAAAQSPTHYDIAGEHTAPAPAASDTAEKTEDTVCWTAGGSVYHVSKDCSSLKNSKEIKCGTRQQAEFAGKQTPCRQCGKIASSQKE